MTEDEIIQELRRMWFARLRQKDAEGIANDIKASVIDHMTDESIGFDAEYDEMTYRVTAKRMQNTGEVVDEAALKKELGAKLWKKVTTPTLDKDKLEEAIVTGLVDPVVVAKHTKTITTSSPYIRFNRRKR